MQQIAKTMNGKISTLTVTCNRPTNYGAVLQTYGLNTALMNMGINARVLDYDPYYYYSSTLPIPLRLIRNAIRLPDHIQGKRVFGQFLKDFVPMSNRTYHNVAEIQADTPRADVYIAGSDQIWNCNNRANGRDDTFFLTFADGHAKKISYAASLAMPDIPEDQKERYHRLISSFDAVSVREPTSIRLLNNIGIPNVISVLDPVFLLQPSDWDIIAAKSAFVPHDKYVLVYGYNRQKNVYRYARALANKLEAKVYTIGTAIEDYTLNQDRYFWNASPTTFVKLIKNAEAVVTNSFHGMVFSIEYNKPFHFFTVKQTTNSRMLDLLNLLNLSDRHVIDNTILNNWIDYSNANESLAKLRSYSLDFLSKAVKGE